jgi:hypothetical protein
MPARSIADILRRMGETPPSVSSVDEECSQPIEATSDLPVSFGSPWLDANRIRASCARDVLERRDDDRSRAERRELYARTLGAAKLKFKFTFGAQGKAKAKAKPAKRERTDETRVYFREYQRRRRAREKAEQSSSPGPAALG